MTRRKNQPAPSRREARAQRSVPRADGRSWHPAFVIAAAILAIAGIVPLANLLTDGPGLVWYGAAARQWLTTTPLVIAGALLISRIAHARVDTAIARLNGALLRPSHRAFGLAVALIATGLTAALAVFAFHKQIFAGDEMSQRFQARVLASGHLIART